MALLSRLQRSFSHKQMARPMPTHRRLCKDFGGNDYRELAVRLEKGH